MGSHDCRISGQLTLKEGIGAVEVKTAMTEFLTKVNRDFDESVAHENLTIEGSDLYLGLDIHSYGGSRNETVALLATALARIVDGGGSFELLDYDTGDRDAVCCPYFVGNDKEREIARLQYGITQMEDWVRPIIGDQKFQVVLSAILGGGESSTKAIAESPEEAPQSGTAMLRHALQQVLIASGKGQITGLYGPLHGYVIRALEQPVEEDVPARQFVEQVANLKIWNHDQDGGRAYHECDVPADGEGDSHTCLMNLIEQARKIPSAGSGGDRKVTTQPVVYWDSTRYNPQGEAAERQFAMEVDDRRAGGNLFVTTTAEGGNPDEMLSCTFEVNRLPELPEDLPCVHLHFDDDRLAASFFKKGAEFIVRPEVDVSFRDTTLPKGERAWILS